METFRCVICTPTSKLLDADVYGASVPGEDGYFGVLPGHERLVGLMGTGGLCTINLDESGSQKKEYLLFKGASQMFNGILTILGAYGVEPDQIDKTAVESHANNLRVIIEDLKSKDDPQDKARIAIFKRNLEWDEFQLDFLAKKNAS